MKLWLITRIDKEDIGWDEYIGFVVAAENETEARGLITRSADEGDIWNSQLKTICREIAPQTSEPAGIVLDSFRAG
jgi:hypothetical protein